jgi:hypothetical protein
MGGDIRIGLAAKHNTSRQTRSKFIAGHDIMKQTISVPRWLHTNDWDKEKIPYDYCTSLLSGRDFPDSPENGFFFCRLAEKAVSMHSSTLLDDVKRIAFSIQL